ncbi:MAG: methyltransferase [Planctomycetota bacterium]|nr:methyltransferase [Planctomycetota bacterium]
MKTPVPLSRRKVPPELIAAVRGPVVVLMGSPSEVGNLLEQLKLPDALCLQLDLHQARMLKADLEARGVTARVEVVKDFWDRHHGQATLLTFSQMGGERELKIDLVDQGFHSISPGGRIVVWCPTVDDSLFPGLLKRFFGKTHAHTRRQDLVLWAVRQDGDDRPRRRHELNFHARVGQNPSQNFICRPGVFSYGKMDDGSRALAEIARVEPGDRVLDLGCGHGTLGVFAGITTGPKGHIVFTDSNARALGLAELNAHAAGLTNFTTVLAADNADLEPLGANSFDVVLANPPYFAAGSIAVRFVEQAANMLKPGGRFYLVTRQPDAAGEVMATLFPTFDAIMNRGYTVLLVDKQMELRPIPMDESALEQGEEIEDPIEEIVGSDEIIPKRGTRGTRFRKRDNRKGIGMKSRSPRPTRRDGTSHDRPLKGDE